MEHVFGPATRLTSGAMADHLMRGADMGESTLLDRFWAKVDRGAPDACWGWTASHLPRGYGLFTPRGVGSRAYAHRVSWEIHNGQIPNGMHVLHRCDNPSCVNPAHLFLGTHLENIADKVSKGRQRRGEGVPSARLRQSQVAEVRAARGSASSCSIALRYGVSPRTIRDIWTGKTWASVPEQTGAQ